jgi:predicted Rossmann-fold nucleotide-binding protein
MIRRIKIIGVMGSGTEPHKRLSAPLGRLIGESGYHLLTGGGYGVMAEVSKAFCEVPGRKGFSIGIIRSSDYPVLDENTQERRHINYTVNEWVEVPIFTHLPLSGEQGTDFMSRNHINVLASDIVIALPGSAGTYSEVKLRVQYQKPLILFLTNADINGKKAEYFKSDPLFSKYVSVANSIDEVREHIEMHLEK